MDEIGRLGEAAQHHPDIDLRPEAVTKRLWTHEVMGLTERDVSLPRQISAAAHDLGVPADPPAVQTVQIAIDALVSTDVLPFWRAVLGYEQLGDDDLLDPRRRSPAIWCQQMKEPRTERSPGIVGHQVAVDRSDAPRRERVGGPGVSVSRLVHDEPALRACLDACDG